jgi:hypothetical protein
MEDLKLGSIILQEFLDQENEKNERAIRAEKERKIVADAEAHKVFSLTLSYILSLTACSR